MKAFTSLHNTTTTEGALDTRAKELIALGIAVTVRCNGCIAYHVRDALHAGAILYYENQDFRDVPKIDGAFGLNQIEVDVSVLTAPRPIYYNTASDLLKRLRPGIDGVVLEVPVTAGGRRRLASAVYLPSVWAQIPDPEQFMNQLSLKAGLPADTWRRPQARILTYQVEEIKESKATTQPTTTQPKG